MGRVYKGVNPTIRSRVAIKVLSHECSQRPDLIDRFFAEARAVNLIRHESIVNVLDLSKLADGPPLHHHGIPGRMAARTGHRAARAGFASDRLLA
jgi:serine/threonine protein kinase